jgi:rhamnosyltransferase
MTEPRPRVLVLLATFNGARFLREQMDSILRQEGVDVRIVASDDGSTDGTTEMLSEYAAADPRVRVLPSVAPTGRSAANFARLLRDAPGAPEELVAFADQDDVWRPGKLARQARIIADGAGGVSSDVLAFDASGATHLIRKAFPQREFDYLCESPGPGSTFLLTAELAQQCRAVLADPAGPAARMDYHDWLIYGVCRALGRRWVILDEPTLDYRQHDDNVMGANAGWRPRLQRLRLAASHWHRGQARLMCEVALAVAPDPQQVRLRGIQQLFTDTGPRARIALARRAGQLRRRPRDAAVLAAMVLGGLW